MQSVINVELYIYHISYIIYHISFIIYHLSYIIYHISYIIYHISYIYIYIYITYMYIYTMYIQYEYIDSSEVCRFNLLSSFLANPLLPTQEGTSRAYLINWNPKQPRFVMDGKW